MYNQPIDRHQWIHVDDLSPNLYNPNHVVRPEMELLKVSIMTDGWLFPVIVLAKGLIIPGVSSEPNKHTIIDGFHRTKLTREDADIHALTEGHVPAIVLTPENVMATTVRMNRAKGVHAVLPMAEIIRAELDKGNSIEEIMINYGMEPEEVMRLANRAGIPATDLITGTDFGNAWVPQ